MIAGKIKKNVCYPMDGMDRPIKKYMYTFSG
jgi:hypothetical protein